MEKLRVLVIGLGHMGEFHLQKILASPLVSKVIGVEWDPVRNEDLSKKYSITILREYKEALKKIDVAIIATPTKFHYEIAVQCLSFGIDVLIEKPVTNTVDEACELQKLAKKNQCILQVGHLERFNPSFQRCRHFLKEPLFIESHRLGVVKKISFDVDVISDLMIHDLDIVFNVIHSPLVRIEAQGTSVLTDKIDLAYARLYFQNEAIANIAVSRVSMKEMRKIRFFQEGSYISLDTLHNEVSLVSVDQDKQLQELLFKEEKQDTLALEIDSFLKAALNRTKPLVTIEDAILSLRIAEDIRKSIVRKNNKIKKARFMSDVI